MSPWWLAVASVLAASPPKEVVQQRATLQSKIKEQSDALELLKTQKVSVLDVLDTYDRLSHDYRALSAQIEQHITALEREKQLRQWQERVSAAAVDSSVKKLGPRLRVLDRLLRRNRLDVLLSAKDFAALVWRARALSTITHDDLVALGELETSLSSARAAQAQLRSVDGELLEQKTWLAQELQNAKTAKANLTDALNWIDAEARQSERVMDDLKAADAELGRILARMSEGPATSGFGALRGKLPMPTEGHIEVGYGDILNPKFNTVTLHKGLDIRAPAGTEVRAVADGKVVYAGWLRGYGNLVIVDQGNGYHTLVAHLASMAHAVGDEVKAGEALGQVGDTGSLKGAYLYFEIRDHGEAVDPAPWLR